MGESNKWLSLQKYFGIDVALRMRENSRTYGTTRNTDRSVKLLELEQCESHASERATGSIENKLRPTRKPATRANNQFHRILQRVTR